MYGGLPITVVRGGYGLFYDTNNVLNSGVDQSGYSRGTGRTLTNNNGLTFLDAVWAHAPFANQQRLAAQVDRTAADWRLSPAETSSIRQAVASAARALG